MRPATPRSSKRRGRRAGRGSAPASNGRPRRAEDRGPRMTRDTAARTVPATRSNRSRSGTARRGLEPLLPRHWVEHDDPAVLLQRVSVVRVRPADAHRRALPYALAVDACPREVEPSAADLEIGLGVRELAG